MRAAAARLMFARAGGGLTSLALLMAPGVALGQARTESTVLMSPNPRARAGQEELGYSDAVIAGDLVFLSGIVAARRPGETDLVPAFERVFRQIGSILERAGSSHADIVEMTSYHTDITAQIEALSQVQRRFLGSPPPAWTAIDVDRLLPEDGVTEIRIIARRSAAAPAQ